MANILSIRGARVHNLKNIDLDIPRDKLVVITGISGSGKSSLAFDTIYAEGQRRYVESLSSYARQFLGLMDKPDVDQIDGLSPAISIDQKTTSHNPRSTVGTVTEIYDYMRLLFARVGHPFCPQCGREVKRQSVDQIKQQVFNNPDGTKIIVYAPLIRGGKGEHRVLLENVKKAGYARVRIDNELRTIDEALDSKIDPKKKHTLEVVVDRIAIMSDDADVKQRLTDALETALELGSGVVTISFPDTKEEKLFSLHFACPVCNYNFPPLEPRLFSFNNPYGACETCTGIGTKLEVDPQLVIPNTRLTLAEGAIRAWSRSNTGVQSWYIRTLNELGNEHGFTINDPVSSLSKEHLHTILYGDRDSRVSYQGYEGVIPNLERRYKETESDYVRSEIENYMRVLPCPSCGGKRLKSEALHVLFLGKSIHDVVRQSTSKASTFFDFKENQKLSISEVKIAKQILKEIRARLSFLLNLGLGYLTLDRTASSLSGGEAQRIRLATQIGSSLVGVLYILDEPSIGLHQRDNTKLITTLKQLRDIGNTVLVVEHDEETMRASDYIIDVGPGAGEHGGKIVAVGTYDEIVKHKTSITGRFLSGRETIASPKEYRKGNGNVITILGAKEFNLKDIDVSIPLGKLVAITGVSGSGKSTLMEEILAKSLRRHFYNSKDMPGAHKEIKGLEHIDKLIDIDQSPIGRTPRSNPATYTGLFTPMRDLYAALPEAKLRGYGPGRFSFNVRGGRCEVCEGDGVIKIEMHFLPDVYVECEECKGQRYNEQALEIHFKGKNIAQVLAMSVDEALAHFELIPAIAHKLATLQEVGLGYIKLGQSATTLSGGEAQRVKLSTELARRSTGRTLYILDEPTTGLHFADVKRLLSVLHKLVDKGNTVLVVEHNMDVIKSSDYVIDLGPEGGDAGGEIVAEGTPLEISHVKKSYTGKYLTQYLSHGHTR